MVQSNIEPVENDTTHLYPPSVNDSLQVPTPIRVISFISDDGLSIAVSSTRSSIEPNRSSSVPLISKSENTLPTEPPPSFNPPPYRSVVSLPSYAVWRDKYAALPDDVESNRLHPRTRRYYGGRLPKYGWRIWAIVVLVVVVSIAAIVVALTKTASNGSGV